MQLPVVSDMKNILSLKHTQQEDTLENYMNSAIRKFDFIVSY